MELRKIIKDRTNGQINDFIKLEDLIFEQVEKGQLTNICALVWKWVWLIKGG